MHRKITSKADKREFAEGPKIRIRKLKSHAPFKTCLTERYGVVLPGSSHSSDGVAVDFGECEPTMLAPSILVIPLLPLKPHK